MQIYGPAHLHGAQGINGPHANRAPQTPPRPAAANQADSVDISPAAELAAKLSDIPDIRQDRVNEIRAQIASGTYETDERINGALERLLDEMG